MAFPHQCEGDMCFCKCATDCSDLQEEMNPELQAALFDSKTFSDPPSYATQDLFQPLADEMIVPPAYDEALPDYGDVDCQPLTSRQPTPMSVDPSYRPAEQPVPLYEQQQLQQLHDLDLPRYDDKNLVLGLHEKPSLCQPQPAQQHIQTMSEAQIGDLPHDQFTALLAPLSSQEAEHFKALRRRVKNRRCAAETAKRRKRKQQGLKENYTRLQEEMRTLRKVHSDVCSQNTELNKRAVQAEAKVEEQQQTIQLLQQQLAFMQISLSPSSVIPTDKLDTSSDDLSQLLQIPTLDAPAMFASSSDI